MSAYLKQDFKDVLNKLKITYPKKLDQLFNEGKYLDVLNEAKSIKLNTLKEQEKETIAYLLYKVSQKIQFILKNRHQAVEALRLSKQYKNNLKHETVINKKLELFKLPSYGIIQSPFVNDIYDLCNKISPGTKPIEVVSKEKPEIFNKAKAPLSISNVESVLSIGIYRWRGDIKASEALSMMLRLFKDGEEHAVDVMKFLTFEFIKDHLEFFNDIDVIIPVPADLSRVAIRGYDLAFEIAEVISKSQAIPLIEPLIREVNSEHSKNVSPIVLNEQYKLKNIKKSFIYPEGLKGLIVDDIITSGKTIQSCVNLLDKIGMHKFKAFSLARSESSIKSDHYTF